MSTAFTTQEIKDDLLAWWIDAIKNNVDKFTVEKIETNDYPVSLKQHNVSHWKEPSKSQLQNFTIFCMDFLIE